MMTRTLLPVMEAAVTMSQMSQSGLDEETRAERKCREETVMVTAVEKSGARRKEVRKLAERELRAVMKMTVTTKNPRRRGSLKKKGGKKVGRKRAESSDEDDSDYEKPQKKRKSGGGGGGYNAPVKLSADLADIVGGEEMPRHEVVKRMWAYIKENKLQDPKNKAMVKCDEKLSKICPTKKFRGFGMTKFLKEHMNVE